MQSQIQIGVIGPEVLFDKIRECLKMFPNFQPVFRFSNQIIDAPAFTKELADQVDVLLYSGWSPYSLDRKSVV